MKKRTKIILIIIAILVAIAVFFLSKNSLAKEIVDIGRNVKAFIEVRLSKEYRDMGERKILL